MTNRKIAIASAIVAGVLVPSAPSAWEAAVMERTRERSVVDVEAPEREGMRLAAELRDRIARDRATAQALQDYLEALGTR